MAARVVPVGKAAHDAERQALRFLQERLPDDYTIYANSWLAQRNGTLYELDAVVVAPHAVYVVEIKSFRGAIRGTDHDWLIPEPRRSPLRTNRLTAQILKSELKRESAAAARVWVEGFVFLSHTEDVQLRGTASRYRVCTRADIIQRLTDVDFLEEHLTRGRRPDPVDTHAQNVLERVLTGVNRGNRPPRRVREYELISVLDSGDDYVEHLVEHSMTQQRQVLRVYPIPWSASKALRAKIEEQCGWEASVLVNVGRHPGIVEADPPFREEIGICLPLEYFPGITLSSWTERHLAEGEEWPSLVDRLQIWERVARALHYAHRQGVVHRLLRPDAILLLDKPEPKGVRVVAFDVAKRLDASHTIATSRLDDERMVWAAPEVLRDVHAAEPRSDQFALGALLGLLATGRPVFKDTKAFLGRGGQPPSLHGLDPHLPKGLDEVLGRLLATRPSDRYKDIGEAVQAVAAALQRPSAPRPAPPQKKDEAQETALDPEELEPGTRLGSDYEILRRAGAGGLSTVYIARHLPSGTSRALKVARATEKAEDALRAEYETMRELDHPQIAKALDLSKLVPERLTMVMEHVEGLALPAWLDEHSAPDAALLHRYAEDLFSALDYLESQGITHKDIKPDNLLLGEKGLTLIDFSLVDQPDDEVFIGTALYRDPMLKAWDAAADRYAAALCLFELYVGSHAFDEQAPAPSARLELDPDEVEPPDLAAFFHQALAAQRDGRFGSLKEMRKAFRRSLGKAEGAAPEEDRFAALREEPDAPISEELVSAGLANALRRGGIETQGQLVAARPEQIRRIRNVGRKRMREALAYRSALKERGVPGRAAESRPALPALVPEMVDDERPVDVLDVSDWMKGALREHGYETAGAVAAASPAELMQIPWLGEVKVVRARQALERLLTADGDGEAESRELDLEAAWVQACNRLTERQREVLEARFRGTDGPQRVVEVADELEVSRQAVYLQQNKALERLDLRPLAPGVAALTEALEEAGGILPLGACKAALVSALPSEDEELAALVVRGVANAEGAQLVHVEPLVGMAEDIIALPAFGARALKDFLAEAYELAQWPPKPPDAALRSLQAALPDFDGDPVALAAQLGQELELTASGELYQRPVAPEDAIPFLLHRMRLPLDLTTLRGAVDERFGADVAWPGDRTIEDIVAALDLPDASVEDGRLVARSSEVVSSRPQLEADELPSNLTSGRRSPEELAGQMLRASVGTASWRLVVSPPERHAEIGRSVAAALGADAEFVSFEERFLAAADADFARLERAERFKAMRPQLKRAAEGVFDEIVAQHGHPGRVTVLGDTALFELCDATHLVQMLYDKTLNGQRGFWVLVIPGLIHERQPMLNESEPLFALEGAVLPVRAEIPSA